MGRESDAPLAPFEQALISLLGRLTGKWTQIGVDELTQTEEQALSRLTKAGLVEERWIVTARMSGFPQPVRMRCRVRGDFREALYRKLFQRVPEWLDADGRTKGSLTLYPDPLGARLTHNGEQAKEYLHAIGPRFVLRVVHGKPSANGVGWRFPPVIAKGFVGIESFEVESGAEAPTGERIAGQERPSAVAPQSMGSAFAQPSNTNATNCCRILFLAASPTGTAGLALDEECRAIDLKISAARFRDSLELLTKWAVRPDDLLQHLNQCTPNVVHFSGHGTETEEILLLDSRSRCQAVPKDALRQLFSTLKDNIRVVVLNACYARPQAEAIAEVIDCAIGMKRAIGDKAAIVFAASFYRAIAFGRSVHDAFQQGKAAVMLEGIPEQDTPVLLARRGVDPRTIFLVTARDT